MSQQDISTAAHEIALARPLPDPAFEQFLMTPRSLAEQTTRLIKSFPALSSLAMIGDDDHLSLLLSEFSDVRVSVFEIDSEIISSIKVLAKRRGLDVPPHVEEYDVRDSFPKPGQFSHFYINPPYSSKTRGLGIKVWLTRALEACGPHCSGIIVMPNAGKLDWTRQNLLEVQEFLVKNGCVVTQIDADLHDYAKTSDVGLLSSNFLIERIDPTRRAPIEDIDDSTRIYR